MANGLDNNNNINNNNDTFKQRNKKVNINNNSKKRWSQIIASDDVDVCLLLNYKQRSCSQEYLNDTKCTGAASVGAHQRWRSTSTMATTSKMTTTTRAATALVARSSKNKELMNDIITSCKLKNGFGPGVSPAATSPTKRPLSPDHPNPALPITESPSPAMNRMGRALRTLLVADNSSCLKDRKVSGKLIRKCAPGTELVDWLVNLSPLVHTRAQAAGMYQALLEEGVLTHVNKEQPFKDKCFLYRFRIDEDGTAGGSPTTDDINAANEHVREALGNLFQRGPDATLRMILRKPSHERTPEELELVFEELLHIAALSHLSTSIKRELASIIVFESHAQAGTILFNQGDEGRSWYILLKGSVDVVIHGKGTVATLKTGDDFGKLALINDAPRYTVMSGTPSKMLEHLLETRLGSQVSGMDPFLDDFLLTHIVFMPVVQLVDELANYFHCDPVDGTHTPEDREYIINFKKRVIQFMQKWVMAVRHAAFEEPSVCDFIEDLAAEVEADPELNEETSTIHNVLTQMARYQEDRNTNAGQKWKLPPNGQPICLFSGNATPSKTVIRPDDDIIFRVYCADHTYCTLRFPMHTTAEIIKACAADKLQLNRGPDDLCLVEVKSNGERSKFKDNDVSIPTGLSLNGRLFVSVKDHLDALTPLPEQEGATEGIEIDLEILSTKELAYHITIFDWDLFWAVHEYELLYHTFGRHHFGKITANLDVFLRRFNELQYWIVTEIVSTPSMSKRVGLLRKFIKLAAYCKEFQNLNAFFAIVMGLSNMAVSRLQQTWDKIPSKFRKLFLEFEALIDPSRNHRAYRVFVGKLQPPVIPFMPLLLKDMTFAHEGNKTSLDGLVNFEKMHMMAQTMRTIRFCRSRSLGLEPPSPKSEGEVRSYISCLRVIDNQRVLTAMSQKIEPTRKT